MKFGTPREQVLAEVESAKEKLNSALLHAAQGGIHLSLKHRTSLTGGYSLVHRVIIEKKKPSFIERKILRTD